MAGTDLEKPFRGVRSLPPAQNDLVYRCRALLTRMPSGAFCCGPTAARLQGIPLPIGLERAPELHVGVFAPHRAPRLRGTVGHKLGIAPDRIRDWLGIRVTDPARTWQDLATVLSGVDLVAAGDFLIHGDYPLCTRDELAAAVRAARGTRGARNLACALPLLDGRAESRAESRLRLVLVGAGIVGFEPNHWVTVTRPRVRYRIDIAFPEARIGLEYQGEYHHDIDQWKQDMTRLSRLRADGWLMIEVSSQDLDAPTDLAHRIRKLLGQREVSL